MPKKHKPASCKAKPAAPVRKCERCEQAIPPERLEALPDTVVCVGCAAALGGSEYQLIVIEDRTSKQESYKGRTAITGLAKIRKPIRPL